MIETERSVVLQLSADEALVLFDFLGRFNAQERPELFEDQSEQRALWNLEASLEAVLVDPFLADYGDRVSAARSRLRDLTSED